MDRCNYCPRYRVDAECRTCNFFSIVAPAGATNGDVIKALFPNAWKSNYIDSGNKCTLYIDDDYELEVDIDWWKAPYKRR